MSRRRKSQVRVFFRSHVEPKNRTQWYRTFRSKISYKPLAVPFPFPFWLFLSFRLKVVALANPGKPWSLISTISAIYGIVPTCFFHQLIHHLFSVFRRATQRCNHREPGAKLAQGPLCGSSSESNTGAQRAEAIST